MNEEFQMKKEWKLDAYLCIKGLKNPDIHFNLHNLYMYLSREEILTNEEIQEFERLMRKVTSVEFELQKELFEDDPAWKRG